MGIINVNPNMVPSNEPQYVSIKCSRALIIAYQLRHKGLAVSIVNLQTAKDQLLCIDTFIVLRVSQFHHTS